MLCRFITLFVIAFFSACSSGGEVNSVISQTFKGDRLLHEGVNRIYIDKIYDGNISDAVKDIFKSSLGTRINLSKKLAVVDSPEKSDLILKVMLTGFSSEPVKFNSLGTIEEKKLRIDSFIWLISPLTGEEQLRKKRVVSEQFYSEVNPPVMSEYRAISLLTDQLSDRIVSVIITGWYPDDPGGRGN